MTRTADLVDAAPAPEAAWARRTSLQLLDDQLCGLAAWNRARRDIEQTLDAIGTSREAALDARRHGDALRCETDALQVRSAQHLQAAGELMWLASRPRALLVHRQPWLSAKVTAAFEADGVDVLGVLDDGAAGVGWSVVDQPDLLLVEAMLPTLSGRDVVGRVRAFCPSTIVAVQVGHEDDVAEMLDAGAHLAVPRRVPPAELAELLLSQVRG